MFVITLGVLGNLIVGWSAIAILGFVMVVGITKFGSRLLFYRTRLD